MVDLSIIITSFNTRNLTDKCLKSIYSSDPKNSYEIFVVDNASSDGSVNMVLEKYPRVNLIKNKDNLGFAKANNQALRICQGRYVLLLNSDTEILNNPLDVMIEFMNNHPEVGMINPKLVYPNGNLQPSPSKLLTFWRGAVWEMIFWQTPLYRLFPVNHKYRAFEKGRDYNKVTQIEWARGAFLMIRKEVIEEIGLLDENFFFGYEECDYNIRAEQNGWKRFYVPEAVVIHHGSLSHIHFGRGLGPKIHGAMFYFWGKHCGFLSGLLLRLISVFISVTYILLRPFKLLFSKNRKTEFKKFKYDFEEIKVAMVFLPINKKSVFKNNFFLKKGSHKYIIDFIQRGSKILDVGCDRGQIANELIKDKGCEVFGIEIDMKKKKYFNFEVIIGNIEDVSTMDKISGKFDVIVFGDVLEHLSNPSQVLKNIKKHLKYSGKIIVSLPNIAYWRVRRNLLFGEFKYTDNGILDKTHLRFFTFETGFDMFEECGFFVKSVRYTSGNFSPSGLRKNLASVFVSFFPKFFAYQFVFELTLKND